MAQTFIFQGEAPARLNVRQLEAEMQAFAPEIALQFNEGTSWERWPYRDGLEAPPWLEVPEDIDAPYEQPDVLIVENVPDQYTRQQVRSFILSHLPAETDEEERQHIRARKVIDVLLAAKDADLLELKTRLLGV